MDVLILNEAQTRSLASPALALKAVRVAFRTLGEGGAEQPPSIGIQIPPFRGEMHVKGAYLPGLPLFGFKAASGFDPEGGRSIISGSSFMFEVETGKIRAVLLDNGYLTKLRTGAAGALAADLLAGSAPSTVAIIGTGSQARFQLGALIQVRPLARVVVWGRNEERAGAYAREMERTHGLTVEVAATVEKAVRGADIVVTTTPVHEPIVFADWVEPGAHVTAIGSDFPDKQELDVGVLAKADRVVADTVNNCLQFGEVHHAVEAGALDASRVEELADLVVGRRPGRERHDQITVADQCGLGVEDTAIGNMVVTEALSRGLGTIISVEEL